MTLGPADHPTESFPLPADRAQLALAWSRWREAAERTDDRDLAAAMLAACSGRARPFLDAVFGNSPYLTSLALRDPRIVVAVLSQGPTDTLAELLARLNREDPRQPRAALMARLRVVKPIWWPKPATPGGSKRMTGSNGRPGSSSWGWASSAPAS
jgi:glutamate-ammonia-ligase adenylyltransferase